MTTMIVQKRVTQNVYNHLRPLLQVRAYAKDLNPFARTWDLLRHEIPTFLGNKKMPLIYPQHADIVILGGGYIGSFVAYWLKTRAGEGLSVVVIEKDPTFQKVQKNLLAGTMSQHFSLPENILLAQFGAEFLRNIKSNLEKTIDIEYQPQGHLVLASHMYASKLEENVSILKEHGVRNELLTINNIKERFPWINTADINLGCIGMECEGNFNPQIVLQELIQKCIEMGTVYINAEVSGFQLEKQRDVLMEGITPGSFERINRVLYKTPDGEEYAVKFAACILAAEDKSGEIARMAKIGTDDGLLKVPLPIVSREEKIYSFQSVNQMGLDTPIIMDTSGLWMRNNSIENTMHCGHVPLSIIDVKDYNSDDYYKNIIKPPLVNRISGCENIEVKGVISEAYDYNTYDETGILGPHPYHNNLYIAAGFGKNGCLFGPGIGRAISELIIDGNFTSIDLTRLAFDRLLTCEPLVEFNVY